MRRRSTILKITEKQFQQQVIQLAKLYHWKVYHTWTSLHSPAGFFDLCMVRRGQLIFAELKTDTGKLTQAQEEWYGDLCGVAKKAFNVWVCVWRPSDFETIKKLLE